MDNEERDLKVVLALYASVAQEVTRYRNREWLNVMLFTGAMFALIVFGLSDSGASARVPIKVGLCVLALSSIFYTSYAHHRLAESRALKCRIEKRIGLDNVTLESGASTGEQRLVRWSLDHDACWNELPHFRRGLCSHLLPFFMADVALAIYGLLAL